jgi:hypothetical protein
VMEHAEHVLPVRTDLRSVLAIATLATFTVWITWRAKSIELLGHSGQARSALMGKPAPDFDLESLDGRRVSLADYRGKTVALTFWASWCAPCRMELPVLTKLYEQTHNSESSFETCHQHRRYPGRSTKRRQLPEPSVPSAAGFGRKYVDVLSS